mmetsp:Transcript_8408/g.10976  ORF Transcript_8408/g.10976 Transcript_8408/m.10976 type:complete len:237 (+) Transcript_8408:126-836(+)
MLNLGLRRFVLSSTPKSIRSLSQIGKPPPAKKPSGQGKKNTGISKHGGKMGKNTGKPVDTRARINKIAAGDNSRTQKIGRNRFESDVADRVYEEWPLERQMLEKLVCIIMKDGKKSKARNILKDTASIIVHQHKKDPRRVLKAAIENTGPPVQIKSRKKGAQRLYIPFPITEEKRYFTGIRFIVDEARKVGGRKMSENLAKELFDASNNEGRAVAKCQEIMKVAAKNRANTFLRWG